MRLIQVTLGAGATQITTDTSIYASLLIISPTTHTVNYGDNTVSATKGVPVATTAAPTPLVFAFPRGAHLSEWYLFGTAADVVNVLYEQAT